MAAWPLLVAVDYGANATTGNCTGGIKWVWNTFEECVNSSETLIAFVLGFVSLLLWIVPIFPQLYDNYKRQRCDGLSILFLLFWIGGDLCNVTGAFLAEQLIMQKVIGLYYIFADMMLLSQWYYYEKASAWRQRMYHDLGSSRAVLPFLFLFSVISISGNFLMPYALTSRVDYSTSFKSRRLLWHFFQSAEDTIGYAVGSISALLYFAGRVPQILKNYKRESTEGVSAAMFVIIVFGNLTYGLSIILAGQGWIYILHHLPWLAGSIGCCFCDIIVLLQYMKYYKKPLDQRNELEKLFDVDQSSP